MSELEFGVDWLAADLADPRERATLSSLKVLVGATHEPITEVHDILARTVRDHVRVPAFLLARWLVVNWWRLRWEPRPEKPNLDWFDAHSWATISGDYPWPAITLSSDGAFVRMEGRAEPIADVATVRYLRPIDVQIPVDDFEVAIDGFAALVEARLASCAPTERELTELIAELREERITPHLAMECRLQALAGFDPGDAPAEWIRGAVALAEASGPIAGDEIIAASAETGLECADIALRTMRESPWTVRLERIVDDVPTPVGELPWQRGRRLAAAARAKLGLPSSGPVSNSVLENLLDTHLPFAVSQPSTPRQLLGAFRQDEKRSAVAVFNPRRSSQRFYLSRLIGAAILARDTDRVLPVSTVRTAFQKAQRSFAQEFLCPWEDLDDFTDENGVDPEGVAAAAEYFEVSEYVILTALVNNEKISRRHLPADVA